VLLESGEDGTTEAPAYERLRAALKHVVPEMKDAPISPHAEITYEIVRVKRGDPAETVLVESLLKSESDLPTYESSMAFPVFGRGRTLYALVGAGISEEMIAEACVYVAGRCSCLVKDANPGFDLLLQTDWETAPASVQPPMLPAAAASDPTEPPAAPPGVSPARYVVAALAAALAGVAAATGILLRRTVKAS
jgi:hypothetical protein